MAYYFKFNTTPAASNTTIYYKLSTATTWNTVLLQPVSVASPVIQWYAQAESGYCFADGTTSTTQVSARITSTSRLSPTVINNQTANKIIATFEDKNGNISYCWKINYTDKNGVTTQVSSVRSGVEKLSRPSLTGGLLDSATFDLRITNNNSVAVTAYLSGEWQSSSNSYEIDRTINIPANSYMNVQFTDDCAFEWIDCYVYFSASGYEDSDESTYQY